MGRAVELSGVFFKNIKEPYGIVAAVIIAVLVGFLGGGTLRPSINPLIIWISGLLLLCVLGIAVLILVLDYRKQLLSPAISEDSNPLTASFAHSLGTDLYYLVEGTATATESEETQSEAYVGLLAALRRKNPGDNERVSDFKRHMGTTVRELARNRLSPSMLQRVRDGIDAQKGQGLILPDDI